MNNKTNSLYFILICLLVQLFVQSAVPEHLDNAIQSFGYALGLGLIIVGAMLQIKGRWKKEEKGIGPIIGIVGTIITILSVLSWLIW